MKEIKHESLTEINSEPSGLMTDYRHGRAAPYTCPTCGETVERDILTFLRHTDRHILEALKELHPEWVEANGESPKVLDFYRAQLGHDPWLGGGNN